MSGAVVMWLGVVMGCTPGEVVLDGTIRPDDTGTTPPLVTVDPFPVAVVDIAPQAGFQDLIDGTYQRGRACLSADLNNDGWVDVVVGNPGDKSSVLINATEATGTLSFTQGPILSDYEPFWGGSIGDLDNDGDNDVFIGAGGNEVLWHDLLFENAVIPGGEMVFTDVAEVVGVQGPVAPKGPALAQQWSSASAHLVDFDNDGWLDIYVNSYILPPRLLTVTPFTWRGRNLLWHHLPNGTYEDAAAAANLHSSSNSKNSVFFDFDDDGDMDLWENNFNDWNHLWENQLAQTGEATFVDVTGSMGLDGADLQWPSRAFGAVALDFNMDGWEDLFVFVRPVEPEDTPFPQGHVLLLNVQGTGFIDLTQETGLNQPFVNWDRDHSVDGVMGGQGGDLNLDGIPDVWLGQGRPQDGTANMLYLSTGLELIDDGINTIAVPQYENVSELIDFPAVIPAEVVDPPPYPYRTHGSCIVDYDNDGQPEIAVMNGGPITYPDVVREPNRLFQLEFEEPRHWLRVYLEGDGDEVNRSGIGSRVTLTLQQGNQTWEQRQWLHGGSGFAAIQDLSLLFGLGQADAVTQMEIVWPGGKTQLVSAPELDQIHRIAFP